MRLIFMGTPEFGVPVLEELISSAYRPLAVYTQPDRPAGRKRVPVPSPVKQVALAHGLPVIQPVSLKEPAELERLFSLKPDIIIVVAFGQILPQRVLGLPPFGCLNLHPSLLPRHRGASPISAAILAGDEETGVSLMLLDEGLDTGPILAQRKVPIEPQDTAESLGTKLAQVGAQLLVAVLPDWLGRRITPRPQDETLATYAPPLSRQEGELNWKLPALELWRRVRAFYPWPGCYTWLRGRRLKVLEALPLPGGEGLEPGTVIALSQDAPAGVVTGGGVLGLRRVQLEGRRPLSAEEFLLGQRDFIGQVLPS